MTCTLTCLHQILQYGQSPLWLASFNGHMKCVELLLEAGALVDVQKEVSVGISVPYLSNHKLDCYQLAYVNIKNSVSDIYWIV